MSIFTFVRRVEKSFTIAIVVLILRMIFHTINYIVACAFTLLFVNHRVVPYMAIQGIKEAVKPFTDCYGLFMITAVLLTASIIQLTVNYLVRDGRIYDGMELSDEALEEFFCKMIILWIILAVSDILYKVQNHNQVPANASASLDGTTDFDNLNWLFTKGLWTLLASLLIWTGIVDDWWNHWSFEPPVYPAVEWTP